MTPVSEFNAIGTCICNNCTTECASVCGGSGGTTGGGTTGGGTTGGGTTGGGTTGGGTTGGGTTGGGTTGGGTTGGGASLAACNTCVEDAATCPTEWNNCGSGCVAIWQCVNSCTVGDSACVTNCKKGHTTTSGNAYDAFAACACNTCSSQCTGVEPQCG
jgi:hypothetical protein